MNYNTIESFINFCDDMIIAEEGAQTDAFKLYVSSDCKKIKKAYRQGNKLLKKDKNAAIKCFKECISAASDLKKRVDQLEKNGKVSRFISYFNPLLMFIHNSRLDSAIAVGNTVYTHRTIYTDELSTKAPNEVQAQVQEALNLMIRKAYERIEFTNSYWKKKKKRK